MIEADHLTRRFGDLMAVEDVSMEIPRGQIAGFLGPNGAGKTTCMRMLCGVLSPTGGRARIDGHDMADPQSPGRRLLGWLPEGAPARDELRVAEYLKYHAALWGGVPAGRIGQMMERCDIGDVQGRLVGQLSRGYRQRVGLAAAMLHDPPALILDEPGTGLDPMQQQTFQALLKDLSADRAILLSTHQLSEAAAVCDVLHVMVGGRIQAARRVDHAGDSGQIIVEARGIDLDACLKTVGSIQGVHVESVTPPWQQAKCETADPEDAMMAIAEAVATAGGVIRRLAMEEHGLDQWVHQALEGRQS
ncbi:MAG: ABC transporter ATP-binding protein [Phycisphaerales bacterium]|nr:ABC transporter ATP-binding protein [Phycisphaerales bacterium]